MKLIPLYLIIGFVLTASAQERSDVPGVCYLRAERDGETVGEVAKRCGYDPEKVAKFNDLLPTSPLPKGKMLTAPYVSPNDLLKDVQKPELERPELSNLEKRIDRLERQSAERWTVLAKVSHPLSYTVFYRPQLVVTILDSAESWLRFDYDKPFTLGRAKVSRRILYASADCKFRRITFSQITDFDASGKQVSHIEHPWDSFFKPVGPNSLGETILQTLCGIE